jgi:nicotinate phosphoribosyltransferase
MVYKLVEVDGRPVAKRSEHKASRGGRKIAVRRHRGTGTATEEIISAAGAPTVEPGDRLLQVPLVRGGARVADYPTLEQSRGHLATALISLPWEGLSLTAGDPAIPVTFR